MSFIHQNPDWPNFRWDNATLLPLLADVRHRQGRLLGRMEGLGFRLRSEATLTTLTSDVIKSSEIEGAHLDAAQVRSSIARRLGLDFGGTVRASRDVEGVVEMMLDATQMKMATGASAGPWPTWRWRGPKASKNGSTACPRRSKPKKSSIT
jgi:Fic family protein